MRVKIQDPAELDGIHYLITGGTGSFGRTMVERLLQERGGEIRVFSRDEAKQDQMRREIPGDRVKYYLGDVRDYDRVREVMQGVSYVFHAAALKQVPACETWPLEAVKTNVLGADNVMRAAIEAQVATCVLLSTDKAVYPVSAMGKSKAMMESLMLARSQRAGNTVLCATRYGNVVGSRGSVIPLFCQQIKAGKPMTVTLRGMTRFMMTLQESVDLVLYAFENALPGDIFVRPAPSSEITQIVNALRMLKGSAAMTVVGARTGEKLHEVLVSEEELARAGNMGDYIRIPAEDLNIHKIVDGEGYSSRTARRLTKWELIDLLKTLPCVQEITQ